MFCRRPWWGDSRLCSKPASFFWRSKVDLNFATFNGQGTPKICNRFERFIELHQKDNVFRNMWFECQVALDYYERSSQDVFQFLPLTFSFRTHEPRFFDDLQAFSRLFLALKEGVVPEKVKPVSQFKDKYGVPHDVYFQFEITIPQRANVPSLSSKFQNVNPLQAVIPQTFNQHKNLWILKPSSMSRGRGLELFTELSQLNNFLRMYINGYEVKDYKDMKYSDKTNISPSMLSQEPAPERKQQRSKTTHQKAESTREEEKQTRNNVSFLHNNTFNTFVIQKYMEDPFLYEGYKFDIRVYAMMNQYMELHVFREAYVRLSSYKYTLDKLNYYIHLTNNAVQSSCKGYGSLLAGNIFGISQLEEYGRREGKKPEQPTYMDQIRDTIKLAFDSVYDILNPNHRKHSFELFGFDFMIDKQHKVYMLECNSGPSLSESNPFLSSLLHRMLDDMFQLTVDKLFPPPPQFAAFFKAPSPYKLLQFDDRTNLWDFVHHYPTQNSKKK